MTASRRLRGIIPSFLAILFAAAVAGQDPRQYFKITVVDEDTGRGVPLVELKTWNGVRYYTDSNGIVAFDEPGLMGRKVFFAIRSHGYEFPEKFFDERGKVLEVTSGGSAILKIRRFNIAERLYRVTGEGIYRDSVLVGAPVPIKHPLLDARVIGQDTVMAAPYRGRIYWFFGDTLGPADFNGGTSGATSEWPGRSGLDPSAGVDLDYFVDPAGFSKAMVPSSAIPGPGLRWTEGAMVVKDDRGNERLVARYDRVKTLGESYERGLLIFNDKTESFDRLVQFDLNASLYPAGRPFLVSLDGEKYYYFPSWYPSPLVRVKADLKHVTDPRTYEGFTCLTAGSRYDKAAPKLDRGLRGRLSYAWKANTPPLDYDQQRELIASGKMRPEEGLLHLKDIDTGAEIEGHSGSVYWNEFRRRWIMIAQRNVGEVWYAEGDTPLGPWVYAKKIVSHDRYTFYWPGQHPFFDQEGGRLIYFEGTYTNTFSGNPDQTPRYNYNQIMYRLKLDDPRLFLPVPIYQVKTAQGRVRYLTREGVEAENVWDRVEAIPFFAVPPDRAREGLLPIFEGEGQGGTYLAEARPPGSGNRTQPLFYALPAVLTTPELTLTGTWDCMARSRDDSKYPFVMELKIKNGKVTGGPARGGLVVTGGTFESGRLRVELRENQGSYVLTAALKEGKLAGEYKQINGDESGMWEGARVDFIWTQQRSSAVVPLYEYRRGACGPRLYSVDPDLKDATLKRSAKSIGRVWRNPTSLLILDRRAKPDPIGMTPGGGFPRH